MVAPEEVPKVGTIRSGKFFINNFTQFYLFINYYDFAIFFDLY